MNTISADQTQNEQKQYRIKKKAMLSLILEFLI